MKSSEETETERNEKINNTILELKEQINLQKERFKQTKTRLSNEIFELEQTILKNKNELDELRARQEKVAHDDAIDIAIYDEDQEFLERDAKEYERQFKDARFTYFDYRQNNLETDERVKIESWFGDIKLNEVKEPSEKFELIVTELRKIPDDQLKDFQKDFLVIIEDIESISKLCELTRYAEISDPNDALSLSDEEYYRVNNLDGIIEGENIELEKKRFELKSAENEFNGNVNIIRRYISGLEFTRDEETIKLKRLLSDIQKQKHKIEKYGKIYSFVTIKSVIREFLSDFNCEELLSHFLGSNLSDEPSDVMFLPSCLYSVIRSRNSLNDFQKRSELKRTETDFRNVCVYNHDFDLFAERMHENWLNFRNIQFAIAYSKNYRGDSEKIQNLRDILQRTDEDNFRTVDEKLSGIIQKVRDRKISTESFERYESLQDEMVDLENEEYRKFTKNSPNVHSIMENYQKTVETVSKVFPPPRKNKSDQRQKIKDNFLNGIGNVLDSSYYFRLRRNILDQFSLFTSTLQSLNKNKRTIRNEIISDIQEIIKDDNQNDSYKEFLFDCLKFGSVLKEEIGFVSLQRNFKMVEKIHPFSRRVIDQIIPIHQVIIKYKNSFVFRFLSFKTLQNDNLLEIFKDIFKKKRIILTKLITFAEVEFISETGLIVKRTPYEDCLIGYIDEDGNELFHQSNLSEVFKKVKPKKSGDSKSGESKEVELNANYSRAYGKRMMDGRAYELHIKDNYISDERMTFRLDSDDLLENPSEGSEGSGKVSTEDGKIRSEFLTSMFTKSNGIENCELIKSDRWEPVRLKFNMFNDSMELIQKTIKKRFYELNEKLDTDGIPLDILKIVIRCFISYGMTFYSDSQKRILHFIHRIHPIDLKKIRMRFPMRIKHIAKSETDPYYYVPSDSSGESVFAFQINGINFNNYIIDTDKISLLHSRTTGNHYVLPSEGLFNRSEQSETGESDERPSEIRTEGETEDEIGKLSDDAEKAKFYYDLLNNSPNGVISTLGTGFKSDEDRKRRILKFNDPEYCYVNSKKAIEVTKKTFPVVVYSVANNPELYINGIFNSATLKPNQHILVNGTDFTIVETDFTLERRGFPVMDSISSASSETASGTTSSPSETEGLERSETESHPEGTTSSPSETEGLERSETEWLERSETKHPPETKPKVLADPKPKVAIDTEKLGILKDLADFELAVSEKTKSRTDLIAIGTSILNNEHCEQEQKDVIQPIIDRLRSEISERDSLISKSANSETTDDEKIQIFKKLENTSETPEDAKEWKEKRIEILTRQFNTIWESILSDVKNLNYYPALRNIKEPLEELRSQLPSDRLPVEFMIIGKLQNFLEGSTNNSAIDNFLRNSRTLSEYLAKDLKQTWIPDDKRNEIKSTIYHANRYLDVLISEANGRISAELLAPVRERGTIIQTVRDSLEKIGTKPKIGIVEGPRKNNGKGFKLTFGRKDDGKDDGKDETGEKTPLQQSENEDMEKEKKTDSKVSEKVSIPSETVSGKAANAEFMSKFYAAFMKSDTKATKTTKIEKEPPAKRALDIFAKPVESKPEPVKTFKPSVEEIKETESLERRETESLERRETESLERRETEKVSKPFVFKPVSEVSTILDIPEVNESVLSKSLPELEYIIEGTVPPANILNADAEFERKEFVPEYRMLRGREGMTTRKFIEYYISNNGFTPGISSDTKLAQIDAEITRRTKFNDENTERSNFEATGDYPDIPNTFSLSRSVYNNQCCVVLDDVPNVLAVNYYGNQCWWWSSLRILLYFNRAPIEHMFLMQRDNSAIVKSIPLYKIYRQKKRDEKTTFIVTPPKYVLNFEDRTSNITGRYPPNSMYNYLDEEIDVFSIGVHDTANSESVIQSVYGFILTFDRRNEFDVFCLKEERYFKIKDKPEYRAILVSVPGHYYVLLKYFDPDGNPFYKLYDQVYMTNRNVVIKKIGKDGKIAINPNNYELTNHDIPVNAKTSKVSLQSAEYKVKAMCFTHL